MEGAIVLVTLGVTAINVLAVVLGRGRETKAARIAFASGLVALSTFPMSFVAALLGFIPAPLDGPAPVLLVLCLGILAGATLCSAAMLVPLFRNTGPGPNNSSKPTPLRGAA
jgi:hypothetical protein